MLIVILAMVPSVADIMEEAPYHMIYVAVQLSHSSLLAKLEAQDSTSAAQRNCMRPKIPMGVGHY